MKWMLQVLVSNYRFIEAINHDLLKWRRVAFSDDTNPNVRVFLDGFANMLPKSIDHDLEEFEPLLAPYMA